MSTLKSIVRILMLTIRNGVQSMLCIYQESVRCLINSAQWLASCTRSFFHQESVPTINTIFDKTRILEVSDLAEMRNCVKGLKLFF